MKKILLTSLLILFITGVVFSQNVSFDYDNTGNRIARNLFQLKNDKNIKFYKSNSDKIINNENKIIIKPNPNNGKFTICLNAEEKSLSFEIIIFTLEGKVIFRKNNLIDKFYSVDISNAENGIYIMKIIQKDKNQIFKIIKK